MNMNPKFKGINSFKTHRGSCVFGLLTVAILLNVGGQVGAADTKPAPVALLRGVENARQEIHSGRLEMELIHTFPQEPKRGAERFRLTVAFEGTNRRYDQFQRVLIIDNSGPDGGESRLRQLKAMGGDREAFVRAGLGEFKNIHIRSAYDGSKFMEYSEDLGATVKDPSKGTTNFVFDPRILGLSVWFDMNYDVTKLLAYQSAKSISLVGREVLDGHPTWHVHVVDAYDQDRHFWIADGEDFRVYRCEYKDPYQYLVTRSRYGGHGDESPLPTEVLVENYDGDRKIYKETHITVIKADYNVPVDPEAWTLAGLDLPLGKAVTDVRTHRVAGYWDGEGLTPNLPDALQKGRASRMRPMHWGMVMTGGVVLAVALAAVVYRRNLLREG